MSLSSSAKLSSSGKLQKPQSKIGSTQAILNVGGTPFAVVPKRPASKQQARPASRGATKSVNAEYGSHMAFNEAAHANKPIYAQKPLIPYSANSARTVKQPDFKPAQSQSKTTFKFEGSVLDGPANRTRFQTTNKALSQSTKLRQTTNPAIIAMETKWNHRLNP